jgi:opacity protein-like surface antigen
MLFKSFKTVILTAIICRLGFTVLAQISIKSEYIPYASFIDEHGDKLGGKADLKTIDGGIRIPVSIKMDENNKPTAWAVALSGTYVSMDGDKNLLKDFYMQEILNAQVGLMHMRPLNEKWSMLATLGAGIYTSDLYKISGKAILGQGGVLFIRHTKSNFDWGVGVAINNALGYPMIFPSFYLDWRLDGKYDFKLSIYDSFEISLSSQINDNFKLSIVGESKGLMSAVKKDEKDMYYVAQYGYAGIQPEYKIAEGLSVFATGGVSFARDTYFQSRTLKAFFDSKDDYPHFGVSAYFSAGIKYGF